MIHQAGSAVALIGVARDLSEQARTEEQLLFKTALLEAQLETTIDGILVVGEDGRVILSNQQFAHLWNIPADLLRSGEDKVLLQYAHQELKNGEDFLKNVQYLYEHPEAKTRDEVEFKDGRVFERFSAPLIDSNGRYRGRIFYFRDTTDRRRAEMQLQCSERKYRRLYEGMRDAFVQVDMKGRFVEFNHSYQEMLGYSREELERMTNRDVTPEKWHAFQSEVISQEILKRGYSSVHEKEYRRKDGTIIPVELCGFLLRDDQGQPTGIAAVVRDISERKKLEQDLRQAQKLESVGRLAAGIAHEINTPTQFIGDNIRFIAEAFEKRQTALAAYDRVCQAATTGVVPPSLLAELRQARKACDWDYYSTEIPKATAQSLEGVDRVATIVRAMKEFAHPGHTAKAAADLNRALANTLIVARNEIKYVAEVKTDYGELPPVICHAADMNQVFLNLLINAAHAIGAVMNKTQAKGVITVRTRYLENRVVISISDTGCGIPESIRAHVFDPFFTTKEVGRGTGQGLSIARSIVVEKHGGELTFEPNRPQGTTFIISLPVE